MNTEHLKYFVTAAKFENLTKAAEFLYMNQPSLTKIIKKIESELGTPLFDRNGKRISLNKCGERFYESAVSILEEYEAAKKDIIYMTDPAKSGIRIGATGYFSRIVDLACRFRSEYPECNFDFCFDIEDTELPDINKYDVLIYPYGIKYEKFKGFEISDERYFLAVSQTNSLSAKPLVSIQDLYGLDYVFYKSGSSFQEFPLQVCSALDIPMNSVCYTDSRQMQLQLISSAMAAGFIPEGAKSIYLSSKVKLIPINSKSFTRKLMICFKRSKHLSNTALAFKKMVCREFCIPE